MISLGENFHKLQCLHAQDCKRVTDRAIVWLCCHCFRLMELDLSSSYRFIGE
jgi:hypothetical protein